MTPVPLAQIGLRWRDHRSALWWLGLLYRRPVRFQGALDECTRLRKLVVAFCLSLHSLPYMLLFSAVVRLILFGVIGLPPARPLSSISDTFVFHVSRIAFGIAGGIGIGICGGIAIGIGRGIAFGIAVGIGFGIAVGIALGIGFGIDGDIAFGVAVGIALGIAGRIAIRIAVGIGLGILLGIGVGIGVGILVGITFGIGVGIAYGIALGIALGIAILRVYYHAAHPIYLWPNPRGSWYPYHPVAWDDLCSVPFLGLDRLLVAFTEINVAAGSVEVERLISSYPSQRMAALRARTRLLARESGRSSDLTRLNEIVAGLPEGERGFLGETRRLREMVSEIARLQTHLNTIDRPILREPMARLLCKEIENFQYRVGGLHEPLATEFRAAATPWLTIAQQQWREARAIVEKEPTPQVFRAGDPVNREKEAFVPRQAITGELGRQALLSTGCPGLVLYGRRRVGKSTILHNLPGFLPPSIRSLTISMQDPQAFTSLESLVDHLTTHIRDAWPDGPPDASPHDLSGLFRFLSVCNDVLGGEGKRLLLGLDEYENLDEKIGAGVFPEDLLAMWRESIQSHRNLTWVFAGSHEITELTHAPWTSYLVSARTIEVTGFSEAETRLLLTEPLKHSTLWPRDDPQQPRPRFAPEFWGKGGIERIHAEAGGWPHLVQLIAETVVDLLNDEDGRHVTPALLERALDKAIVSGHNVLYELMHRECRLPGEWEYLSAFRTRATQPPPGDEAIVRSLRRRLLIAEEDGQWRLRVPLMNRWLRARG